MKLKRTNKLLALLLAVLMVMSLLPVTALAQEETEENIKIAIDLSKYEGQVEGELAYWPEEVGTIDPILPGQKNEVYLTPEMGGSAEICGTLTLPDFHPDAYNKGWKIEGTTGKGENISKYIYDNEEDEIIVVYSDLENQYQFIRFLADEDGSVVQFNFFDDSEAGTLFENWGAGTTVTITPILSTTQEETEENIKIAIDLSKYEGQVEGELEYWPEEVGTIDPILPGQKNEVYLSPEMGENAEICGTLILPDFHPDAYNKGWKIEGTTGKGENISKYIYDNEEDEIIVVSCFYYKAALS